MVGDDADWPPVGFGSTPWVWACGVWEPRVGVPEFVSDDPSGWVDCGVGVGRCVYIGLLCLFTGPCACIAAYIPTLSAFKSSPVLHTVHILALAIKNLTAVAPP